jgi:hypothetical protein
MIPSNRLIALRYCASLGPVRASIPAVVAHALHHGLLAGGLVSVAALLWSTRPSGNRTVSRLRDQRVAELREAVRAGTLGVRTSPSPQAHSEDVGVETAAPSDLPWARLAVTGSAGAAAVHAAATPAHVEEGLLLGGFFVTATLVQLGWAVLALRRPRRWLWRAGAAGNALVVLLWVVTRTVGLPFGLLEGPEPVGGWDVAASGFETIVVLGCWAELRRSGRAEFGQAGGDASAAWTTLARAWLLVVVGVVAVLTATGLPT